jgi:hypothetical protein
MFVADGSEIDRTSGGRRGDSRGDLSRLSGNRLRGGLLIFNPMHRFDQLLSLRERKWLIQTEGEKSGRQQAGDLTRHFRLLLRKRSPLPDTGYSYEIMNSSYADTGDA